MIDWKYTARRMQSKKELKRKFDALHVDYADYEYPAEANGLGVEFSGLVDLDSAAQDRLRIYIPHTRNNKDGRCSCHADISRGATIGLVTHHERHPAECRCQSRPCRTQHLRTVRTRNFTLLSAPSLDEVMEILHGPNAGNITELEFAIRAIDARADAFEQRLIVNFQTAFAYR
jgi:hypothetical protein